MDEDDGEGSSATRAFARARSSASPGERASTCAVGTWAVGTDRARLSHAKRARARAHDDVDALSDAVNASSSASSSMSAQSPTPYALSKARAVLAVDSSSPRVRLRAVDERAHVRGSLEESLRSLTAGVSRRPARARATTTVIGVVVIIVIVSGGRPRRVAAVVIARARRDSATSRAVASSRARQSTSTMGSPTTRARAGTTSHSRRASTMGDETADERRATSRAARRRRERHRRAREAEAAPEVTFRNYVPRDDALARGKLPAATAPATSAIGGTRRRGRGEELALESNVGDVDPSMLAPRRVNWDSSATSSPNWKSWSVERGARWWISRGKRNGNARRRVLFLFCFWFGDDGWWDESQWSSVSCD